jgi:hypothetical protein
MRAKKASLSSRATLDRLSCASGARASTRPMENRGVTQRASKGTAGGYRPHGRGSVDPRRCSVREKLRTCHIASEAPGSERGRGLQDSGESVGDGQHRRVSTTADK